VEAVELRRQLAADRAAFTHDVANSLNNLAGCLSDLRRQHEALVAIEEAVELYRPPATDRPAKFNRDLAESLNSLARCLSNLDRQEDALLATEEAGSLQSI
jgi:tetratricopeptide (TPR) repeat protein